MTARNRTKATEILTKNVIVHMKGLLQDFAITFRMIPVKLSAGRPSAVTIPRTKIVLPPARVTSPRASTNCPTRTASRKSPDRFIVTP